MACQAPRYAAVPYGYSTPSFNVRHPSMAPLVRFDAVSVTFGEQQVLIDVDLAIDAGERSA